MNSNPKHIAVVLSGCGVYDGTEIQEAVISLLSLSRLGATYQCIAPDKNQMHVVDHRTGTVAEGQTRNVLTESARIARGNILPLSKISAQDYDAVFLPGGFGAAKNLSNFATDGANGQADPQVSRLLKEFHASGKPIGAVCISPAVLVLALGAGSVTIGNDPATASAIDQCGGSHMNCQVTETHIDKDNKIVTAPAYMYGDASLADIATGIEGAVAQTLALCD